MTDGSTDLKDPKEQERQQLLARLESLSQEGQKYVDEIQRIAEAAGPDHVLGHQDGSITPIEDKDDAMVISMKPRQDLHRVIEQLRELHKAALVLEMSDHPSIIQLGEALQPAA